MQRSLCYHGRPVCRRRRCTGHKILACLPREVSVQICVCCQSSDGFSESCHMLSYDSGSFVPAERPWCGWIDLLCVTVCMNKYERQPLLWVCVSVKGHATLFKGWIMTPNLRPCLLNSVTGPVWCVGSLQDKVGKLGGSCFSFEIFCFSKMQNQFPVHYFLTLGELNI